MAWDAEPTIVINGRELTEAQACTVRIALANLRIELSDPKFLLATGELGVTYTRSIDEIQRIMGLSE